MRFWLIGIAAFLLWSAGSTYWYVCRVKGLCWSDGGVALAELDPNPGEAAAIDPGSEVAGADSTDFATSEGEPANSENASNPDAAHNGADASGVGASSSKAAPAGNGPEKSASAQGAPSERTILFAFATPQLGDASLGSHLDQWAAFLKSNPRKKVRLRGYTDDTAARENNLKLAQRRCDAIAAMLMERGVQDAQIVTEPLGEADPVATNDTPEGRARNRRVVISLNE